MKKAVQVIFILISISVVANTNNNDYRFTGTEWAWTYLHPFPFFVPTVISITFKSETNIAIAKLSDGGMQKWYYHYDPETYKLVIKQHKDASEKKQLEVFEATKKELKLKMFNGEFISLPKRKVIDKITNGKYIIPYPEDNLRINYEYIKNGVSNYKSYDYESGKKGCLLDDEELTYNYDKGKLNYTSTKLISRPSCDQKLEEAEIIEEEKYYNLYIIHFDKSGFYAVDPLDEDGSLKSHHRIMKK